jgi:hypothetical protein
MQRFILAVTWLGSGLIAACSVPVVSYIDPALQAYVKASNTRPSNFFGQGMALSGNGLTLAVGAPAERSSATGINGSEIQDLTTPLVPGAVYVFASSGMTWTQQAYVKASNTKAEDRFGSSVALSSDGSTLAVGAPQEGSAAIGIDGNQADDTAFGAGAVYVFTRDGTSWSQQAYVKASNTGKNDHFGLRIALSGDGSTLAVGAEEEDSEASGIDGDQTDNSSAGAGAVYVFARSGSTWSHQAYIKASNTGPEPSYFGASVALSDDGSTLAIGARGEDSGATGIDGDETDRSADNAGAVYVFSRSGSTWSQQAYVKASNTDGGDTFGISVALSADGSTLAAGASGEASAATGIDGDRTDNSSAAAGAVYVFTRSVTTWSQQAYVKASNTDPGDAFGFRVALSGNGATLVVGAFAEASGATGIGGDPTDNSVPESGAVYVFMRNGTTWLQQGYVKASNPGAGDTFGGNVALSHDGSVLAVGADEESSSATGVNGDQTNNAAGLSGAVYLFSQ